MLKINKEVRAAIVSEYLSGGISLRKLGVKYGVNFMTIHNWVEESQGKTRRKRDITAKLESIAVPSEVEDLKAELRRAKLHNELLEEMLKLSENLTGIDLRKKFGTRQF